MQFLLDGAPLGDADLESPYEVAWPTLAVANGTHELAALARDGAGPETTAVAVNVTVLNDLAPPTVALASPAAGTTVHGTITVTATAGDDIGVSSVQFLLDGASLGAPDSDAAVRSGLADAGGDQRRPRVDRRGARRRRARDDRRGRECDGAQRRGGPDGGADESRGGATVGGTVTVAATAADDIGVTSVQFLLDGAPLGARR